MKAPFKTLLLITILVVFSLFALRTADVGKESKEKLCQQAIATMEKNDFGAAQKLLGQALQIDPQYAKANYALAVCYLRANPPDLKKAVECRDKAKALGYVIPVWFENYFKKVQVSVGKEHK